MATCGKIWNWIIQILLFASFIFFMIAVGVGRYKNEGLFWGAFSTFITFYLIYIISNCCSNTCSYLVNKKKNETIHSYMISLFKEAPKISFSVQCYHYETRVYTTTDSNGNTTTHTETIRVNTYSATEEYYYKSFRDTSGTFMMDLDKVLLDPKKYYLKLHLSLNIYPSDDGSAIDYASKRDAFYNSNRWRDTHMDTFENKNLNGYVEYNLVSVGSNKPICVDWFSFFFWTLLGMSEFYKCWVDHFCVKQNFIISKEFSAHRDLTLLDNQKGFDRLPSIKVGDDVITLQDPAQVFQPAGSRPNSLPSESNMMTAQTDAYNPEIGVVIPMTNQIPANQATMMTMQVQAQHSQGEENNDNDLKKGLLDKKD